MIENKKIRDKIIRARSQFLIRRPFYGHLTLGLELRELSPAELESLPPQMRTAATDGKYLFYNPAYIDKLDPPKLQTLLVHEVLHPAFGHLWRKGDRDRLKWNFAADYVVNLILKKEGFTPIPNWLCDDKYEGMYAEEVYNRLPDQLKGSLLDSHDMWPGDDKKDDKESGNSEGNPNKPQFKNSEGGQSKSFMPSQSPEEQRKLAQDWKDKLVRAATAARMQGKLPGAVDKLIKDLLEPRLDWKIILRDMIISLARNDFRLFPASKRHLWRHIYLPSLYGERLEIAVAVDTSGSISEKEFQEFIAEIRGITEQFSDFIIHLFFCDSAIHDRITLSPNDEWPAEFPKRNGGTSFIPVIKTVTEEYPQVLALVYLTDGEGSYTEFPPEYPVIWVLNNDVVPPWGQHIRMEANDGN